MNNINEMELQNLRHLLLQSEMDEGKYSSYAQEATDQNVKQFFQKSAQSATKNKQQLMQFLQ
jgi:type III secretory pathway component EscR